MAAIKKSPKAERETLSRWLAVRETARDDKPLAAEAIRFAERAWNDRKKTSA